MIIESILYFIIVSCIALAVGVATGVIALIIFDGKSVREAWEFMKEAF